MGQASRNSTGARGQRKRPAQGGKFAFDGSVRNPLVSSCADVGVDWVQGNVGWAVEPEELAQIPDREADGVCQPLSVDLAVDQQYVRGIVEGEPFLGDADHLSACSVSIAVLEKIGRVGLILAGRILTVLLAAVVVGNPENEATLEDAVHPAQRRVSSNELRVRRLAAAGRIFFPTGQLEATTIGGDKGDSWGLTWLISAGGWPIENRSEDLAKIDRLTLQFLR